MTEEQHNDPATNTPTAELLTPKAPTPSPPPAPTAPKAPAPAFHPSTAQTIATDSNTPSQDLVILPALPQECPGKEPPPSFINAAAQAVALSLGSTPYAVVGGAACTLLGSQRTTTDVDIVVSKGQTKLARDKLAAHATHFSVDPKTRHTAYISKPGVQIEILTPPMLFKENFDETTPTEMVMVGDRVGGAGQGVKVLKPTVLLNAKCRSILGRARETRKACDAGDVKFLLAWCASKGMWPTAGECPSINVAFVNWFVMSYGGGALFESAGWDEVDGMLLSNYMTTPPPPPYYFLLLILLSCDICLPMLVLIGRWIH